jgi:hypothetical protein
VRARRLATALQELLPAVVAAELAVERILGASARRISGTVRRCGWRA